MIPGPGPSRTPIRRERSRRVKGIPTGAAKTVAAWINGSVGGRFEPTPSAPLHLPSCILTSTLSTRAASFS
jgi:hypothetical protein